MEIIYFRGSLLLCRCRWLLWCHIEFYGDSLINFQTEIIQKKKISTVLHKNWWCSMMTWHQNTLLFWVFSSLGQLFPLFIQNKVTVPTADTPALVLWLFFNSGQQHSTIQTRIPVGPAMKTKASRLGKFKHYCFLWESQGGKSSQRLLQTGTCQTSFFLILVPFRSPILPG